MQFLQSVSLSDNGISNLLGLLIVFGIQEPDLGQKTHLLFIVDLMSECVEMLPSFSFAAVAFQILVPPFRHPS